FMNGWELSYELDVGCWMLDAGCWMLDVGCWPYPRQFEYFDFAQYKLSRETSGSGTIDLKI
ncbi:MAG: hypothetical protein ACXVEB_13685, partial [Bacteroidia bacterium]